MLLPVTAGKSRVLLVDDDADAREAVSEELTARGYEVVPAGGGEEALRLLAGGPAPCVVLVDLLMPSMDGAEFLARMRQDPRLAGLPVVVLTGIASSRLKRLLDAKACFVKPFDTGDLCREIDRICAARARP